MQEVLLQSVSKLPKFENAKALVVWLCKVAKSRCLMSRRKSKFAPKEALSLDELMPDRQELAKLGTTPDATPENAVLRRENAKRLREAVQKLSPDYRLVLVLHDMEDLSDQEIAEITGLEPGTIRVRLHRARLFVRKELAKEKRAAAASVLKPEPQLVAQPRSAKCKQLFSELSDYLDDKLDDSLCDELEKHLRGCEPCEAFLSDLKRSIEQCRTARSDAPPDPTKAAKLRRELLAQYEQAMKSAVARTRAQQAVSRERR